MTTTMTTTQIPDPGPTEPHVSWSQLQVLADCGEKFHLSYIQKAPREPQGAFLGGIAVHRAIERAETEGVVLAYHEGADEQRALARDVISAMFLESFDALVSDASGPIRWAGRGGNEDDRWWRRMGPAMCRRFLTMRDTDSELGMTVLEETLERSITMALPSGMTLVVRLDAAMMVDSDGLVVVRDYKTGRPGGANPIQLAVYAYALRHALGITASVGEFAYLRSDDRPAQHDLTALIPIVPDLFSRHEATVAAGAFLMNPGPFCKACAVRARCPYGSTLD